MHHGPLHGGPVHGGVHLKDRTKAEGESGSSVTVLIWSSVVVCLSNVPSFLVLLEPTTLCLR